MAKALPKHVDVAIIGGGIVGCSIAYHLTKIGITSVAVLERKQLTTSCPALPQSGASARPCTIAGCWLRQ